ncbi:MAG: cache domain-containing protein [Desulfopila sp.]
MIQTTRNSLFIGGILAAVVLIIAAINYRITRHIVEKTIASQQEELAEKTANTVKIWLNQQMNILVATADSIDLATMGDNDQTMKPLKLAMKAGHFSDVYIGRKDGVLLDGADWVPPPGYDPRKRPWFRRAVATGTISFTTPYIDFVTNKLVIALVKPLFIDNELAGVIGADTVLDSLETSVLNLKVGDSGYLFIVEKSGAILVHPNQSLVMKERLHDRETSLVDDIQRFLTTRVGSIMYRDNDNRQHVLSFCNIENSDWFLCVTEPRNEIYSRIRKSTMIFTTEIALKVLAILSFVVMLIAGISSLSVFFFSKRYSTAVQRHQQQLTGINRDLEWNITRRREVETYYQTLFNVVNDAIFICQGQQVVECNHMAEKVFGRSRDDILTTDVRQFSSEQQLDGTISQAGFQHIIRECRNGEPQIFRWSFLRADGTEFPASVGISEFVLDNRKLTLLSVRDISKRVDAEGQLMQAQKMAAVGEMLGAIAHQWRQPLNTLATYISSLQAAYYTSVLTKEMMEKIVGGANDQIHFMSKTIDDFRNFFKPAKTKGPVNILESTLSAVKLMQAQMRHNGIHLTVRNNTGGTAAIACGYTGEFIHVLVNILANAKDAIASRFQADPDTAKTIDIVVSCRPEQAIIEIIDSGGGIPETLLPKIFNPYYTTKGATSGTGMGLYMSKMIIEKAMDGDIQAENTDNGAKFTITLKRMAESARATGASGSSSAGIFAGRPTGEEEIK